MVSITKCKKNHLDYTLGTTMQISNQPNEGLRTRTCEEYELNNHVIRDLEESWLDNGVLYQLCDHICKPYRFKNGVTKWPTCSSDIDGFCNGGELPGMVRVGNMNYFQDRPCYKEIDDMVYSEKDACSYEAF
nr:hypothetical protein [Tanacetum cinerariifolium]